MNSLPRSRTFGEIGLLGWRRLPPRLRHSGRPWPLWLSLLWNEAPFLGRSPARAPTPAAWRYCWRSATRDKIYLCVLPWVGFGGAVGPVLSPIGATVFCVFGCSSRRIFSRSTRCFIASTWVCPEANDCNPITSVDAATAKSRFRCFLDMSVSSAVQTILYAIRHSSRLT